MEEFITEAVTFACVLGFATFVLAFNYHTRYTIAKLFSYMLICLSIFFMALLLWKMFVIVGEY